MNQHCGIFLLERNACLVSLLAKELIFSGHKDLRRNIILLPTQRLVSCLLAKIAETLGAFHPPQIFTLEQFVEKSFLELATIKTRVLSQISEELILQDLLNKSQYQHLQTSHLHEIRQIFKEICEWGLEDVFFSNCKDILGKDYYRDEEHLKQINLRFDELQDLHQKFYQSLSLNNYILPSQKEKNYVQALLAEEESVFSLSSQRIIVAGLTTVKPYYQPLLKRLLQEKEVSLWLSDPPKLLGSVSPIKQLLDFLDPSGEKTSYLNVVSSSNMSDLSLSTSSRNVEVFCSDEAMDEVGVALELLEAYLAQGIKPSEIAILLSNEKVYSGILRTLLQDRDIPVNLASTEPLSHTALGLWLFSFLDFFEKVDLSSFCDFITHPITQICWQRKSSLELSDEQLITLRQVLLSSNLEEISSQNKIFFADQMLSQFFSDFLVIFKDILSLSLNSSEKEHFLGLKVFTDLLHSFSIWDDAFLADIGLGASAKISLQDFILAMQEVNNSHPKILCGSSFFTWLRQALEQVEVRQVGYPLSGVQILDLVESRYVPFQVAMILGCVEGSLPKALPQDVLIDNWLKVKAGLPGWNYIEALEETTFCLLKERIPKLCLFYPKNMDLNESVRSRFIELILAKKSLSDANYLSPSLSPLSKRKGDKLDFIFPRKKNQISCGKVPFEWRHELLSSLKVSDLERLLQCPYSFLLKKYQLSSVNNHSQKLKNYILEGEGLHLLFEAFFSGKVRKKRILPPLENKITHDLWFDLGMKRFQTLFPVVFPEQQKSSLLFHLQVFSWPKFLLFLKDIFCSKGQSYVELPLQIKLEWNIFDEQKESLLKVELKSETSADQPTYLFDLGGIIDRLDIFSGHFMLTDYKRKTIAKTSSKGEQSSIQLAAYALLYTLWLRQSKGINSVEGLFGYWSFLEATWNPRAVSSELKDWACELKLTNSKTKDLSLVIKNLKSAWYKTAYSLLAEMKDFTPRPGEHCRRCSYLGVCRVAEPKLAEN